MRSLPRLALTLMLLLVSAFTARAAFPQTAIIDEPDDEELAWIGREIFNNECSMRASCLTSWNAGEDFPSLGIGHFIWYRQGQEEIYEETFPQLLAFLETRGIDIPRWLVAADYDNPWRDREQFRAELDSPPLASLRDFLQAHIPEQTAFIVQRFDGALARMLERSSAHERDILRRNFQRVANSQSPHGLYALIDYINFKGEGISEQERYRGQGWGLKQVLLNMPADADDPLAAFVASAGEILRQRVANAEPARNEDRWLPGWLQRLQSYLPRHNPAPGMDTP